MALDQLPDGQILASHFAEQQDLWTEVEAVWACSWAWMWVWHSCKYTRVRNKEQIDGEGW